MKVGFTGTRDGMTPIQAQFVYDEVRILEPTEAHHGMCVGADEEFDELLGQTYVPLVHGHPPTDTSLMAEGLSCDVLSEPKPYLQRNRDIVDQTEHLIAAPRGMTEEHRSGTWSTVSYARRLRRPITICWPDGTVTREPIPTERREAAGKIGDDNAPQTQGPEVDARRLPDV